MKVIARSLVVIFVALIAVPALAVSVTITTAVQLLAAVTGLYMGGTQHPLSVPPDTNQFINEYMDLADNNYIKPGTGQTPTNRVAVIYPAEFFPVFGSTTFDDSVDAGRDNLNSCIRGQACNGGAVVPRTKGVGAPGTTFIVFGYSQSAVVASLVKGDLIEDPAGAPDDTRFVLDSNPMRPNGGILGRGFEGLTIPILGITFYGPTQNSCPDADPCTTEDTGGPVYSTVDTAQQYDLLGGDAPARLDLLAFANSIAAYALLHGNVPNRTIDGTDPQVISQGEYGDTDYYMITAPRLPILMLAERAGVPDAALALPDAILRVWIEDKYVRDQSPGAPVPFQLSPIGNPIHLVGNMLGAIPVGIDDTIAEATGDDENRPLGTKDVYRPFGVGGPVYDKTTGARTTDNVGIPTGSGDYDTQTSLQTLEKQQGDEVDLNKEKVDLNKDKKADEFVNGDTPPTNTAPERKLDPFGQLRDSLKVDPSKRPSALRPNGDGPLKRIVNALTGQRPKPVTEAEPSDEKKPVTPAA